MLMENILACICEDTRPCGKFMVSKILLRPENVRKCNNEELGQTNYIWSFSKKKLYILFSCGVKITKAKTVFFISRILR